jgi:molybdopterin-containing oxidoreductase family iron-sulfur binding subunit
MGIEYWKSLEELAESPEVLEKMSQEFPGYDPKEISSLSRRRFMQLMSASMALAGLTLSGCRRWPRENLAPYSSNPRERVAGIPEQYATVYEISGVGHGVLATSYDGRPIKIEGNPSHPFAVKTEGSLGACNAFHQASVLELYDPARSRSPIDRTGGGNRIATWDEFQRALGAALGPVRDAGGRGLAILSEISHSPSVQAMRQRFKQVFPQAVWSEYEPLIAGNESEASQATFGRQVRTRLFLDKADCVVLFDADVLGMHPAHIRYANDWSKRRRSADEKKGMLRLYAAESQLSVSGAVADERLGAKPSRLPALVSALAAKAGVAGMSAPEGLSPEETRWVEAAATDIKKNGLVVGGATLPAPVLALIHRINDAIGAVGNTVALLDLPANDATPIADLVAQMKSGAINTLLIIGGNPAYDAPADLGFADALPTVANSVHLSLYFNETSQASKWHLPKAHYLESWGDARAWDGTVSIQQPLILPLFGGKSTIEFLALLCGDDVNAGDAIVRRTFTSLTGNNAESAYRRVLHDGVLPESGFATVTAKPQAGAAPEIPAAAEGFEIVFQADRSLYDGRFANNGWLQELPDSLSKLTWDNAALISKKDADSLGVTNGSMLRITVGDRSLDIAAFILPGQPLGVIGLPLGYGRTAAGKIGTGVGFDTYKIRTSATLYSATGVKVAAAGGSYTLVATQEHHIIDPVGFEGRQQRIGEKGRAGLVVHEATLAEYEKNPRAVHEGGHHTVSLQLFNPPSDFRDQHAWGMAIDMTTCIGCNACVAACQAENNIPIVGKDQVAMNREMHWIRIDRYFKGAMDDPNPEIVFQPMTCVHCENAPCEQVCPVAATVHDSEGLNVMVYNRCIGTRYCSNNCPYKVRRFNYFDWHSKSENNLRGFPQPWLGIPDEQQQQSVNKIRRMVFNPEVTVRMRGVMEKCTYCVQRIHGVKQAKSVSGEALRDGDIITACQQTCPTEAIVFGDLADPNSRVSKLHTNPRAYSVLEDLNTRPRTRHLALVRNPNESETGSAS